MQSRSQSLRARLECRCLLPGEDDREVPAQLRGRGGQLHFIQDFDIDTDFDIDLDFDFDFTMDFDLIFDFDFILDYDITIDFGGIYIEIFDLQRRRHGSGRHPEEADAGDGAHWQEA